MKKIFFIVITIFALTILFGDVLQAQTTKTKQKKAMSHRKKGALIGGGVGAVTGAVVSKHHVKGAVIGAGVGAGTGYLIGRHKDKKHPAPRYKTKTKTVQ